MVYPHGEVELIDFLNICNLMDSEVMLYPRCISIFGKKEIEGLGTSNSSHRTGPNKGPNFAFNKRGIPYRKQNMSLCQ